MEYEVRRIFARPKAQGSNFKCNFQLPTAQNRIEAQQSACNKG